MAVQDGIEAGPNTQEAIPEASTSSTSTQCQLIDHPESESQDSTASSVSLQTVARLLDDNVVAKCEETVGGRRRRSSAPLVIATRPAPMSDFVEHEKQPQSGEAALEVVLPP